MASAKNVTIEEIKEFLKVSQETNSIRLFVTPKQAKWLISHCNKGNRRMRTAHVQTLKRDMENDNWHSDSDYISFSKDGILVNGQHRLKALSDAKIDGILLKMDFDVEQHISMDTGISRKYSDQVRMSSKLGHDIMPEKIAKIVRTGVKLSDSKINLSNSELQDIWEKYGDKIKFCENNGLFDLGPHLNLASVHSSILWAYMYGVDIEILKNITEVLRSGMTNKKTDIPTLRLRDELLIMKGAGRGVDQKRAAYTQQCIFDTLRGSESNRLPARPILHYQVFNILD